MIVLTALLAACAEPEPSDAEVTAATAPVPATATAVVAVAPAEPTPEGFGRSGEAIVEQYCVVCHGRGLYDAPKIGDAAAWQAKLAEGREHLWQVVLHGEKAMPPRGNCLDCSDDELRAAMDYLIDQSIPAPPAPTEPAQPATPIPTP